MNKSGLTAFMDVMIFLVIIMMAIAATIVFTHNSYDRSYDPDTILDKLSGTEVRFSDFTEEEDDTLLSLPNMMAYSLLHETDIDDYLSSILDSLLGEKHYRLTYTYDDLSRKIGDGSGDSFKGSTKTYSLVTGGSIEVELNIYG